LTDLSARAVPNHPGEVRLLYVSLSPQPVSDRPFLGRKATSIVCIEAETGSMLTARAFDPRCSHSEQPPHGSLRGSHGEVALVHGAVVFMSSE